MRSPRADRSRAISLQAAEPAPLLEFLRAKLPHKSRNSLKGLLARGAVAVDGATVTRFDHALRAGQRVVIGGGKPAAGPAAPAVRVVFEDEHLVVIDKPPGLLSVPSDSERVRTARASLGGRGVFTVHRLDREASGLMLYAKSREVQKRLQDSWQEAVHERGYVAVVEGRLERDQGTVTSWLKQNRNFVVYSSRVPGDGQRAVTRYRVLRRSAGYTLVEAHLETGRKNQIRVAMQDLGHSIVGDAKYGSSGNPLRRLALHALALAFDHPVTGEKLRFETPVPPEFLRLLAERGPRRRS
jgi:23S rRNA pseudouridine1911/1915/1917 synthase